MDSSEGVRTLRIALELQRIVSAVTNHIKQAVGDDPNVTALQSHLRLVLYNCSLFLDVFYASPTGAADPGQKSIDNDSQACLDVLRETNTIISSGAEDAIEKALVYFYEHRSSFQAFLNEPEVNEINQEDVRDSSDDEESSDGSVCEVEDTLNPNTVQNGSNPDNKGEDEHETDSEVEDLGEWGLDSGVRAEGIAEGRPNRRAVGPSEPKKPKKQPATGQQQIRISETISLGSVLRNLIDLIQRRVRGSNTSNPPTASDSGNAMSGASGGTSGVSGGSS